MQSTFESNTAQFIKTTAHANLIHNPILERQIDEITAGIADFYAKALRTLSEENIKVIVDYILSAKTEINCSDHYRRDIIHALTKFAKHNNTNFKQVTRENIISYLNTFRKSETADSMHRWIGSYNTYLIHLSRFLKWLYSPNLDAKHRPKPSILDNIAYLTRKEKSIYKPSDLWTQQDDLLFLKYCPSLRDKCYHAVSRDLSCRPHEILRLKIRDITFKTIGKAQYAEVVVNGKTGTRAIPLINSIPYLKDYLDHEHPQPGNPNSPFISGICKSLGRHLSSQAIAKTYKNYKNFLFPKLLESPNILPEDKGQIRELLKKPWNPYIRRHSALTEKSQILREHVLRQHAGWSGRSQMHLKYLHYFGNESSESLLEAYGIMPKGQQIDQLKPKQCPNCMEPNKSDSKFCAKCRMVLTYDAYSETIEEKQKSNNDLETLKQQMQTLMSIFGSIGQEGKQEIARQLIEKGIYKKANS